MDQNKQNEKHRHEKVNRARRLLASEDSHEHWKHRHYGRRHRKARPDRQRQEKENYK
jgi:hypothetical protein